MSEVENQSGEKVFVLKKKYIAVFAAVAAVVIIILSVIFSGPSDKQISIFYTGAESGAVIVRDDRLSDVVLSGKSVASVRYAENKLREHFGIKNKLHIMSVNPQIKNALDAFYIVSYGRQKRG